MVVMIYSPLTSKQVLAFMPLNTWTEVILISNTSIDSSVYIATTEEKEKKRKEDSKKILLQSNSYEKIKEFKASEIVAVEINGEWYRGKLISFNEFQDDDTRIELIDVGSFHQTKLQNVFILPYYFLYEPLALPIKFKNFIPKTTKLKIRPLLSESILYDGVVLVDVESNNFKLNSSQFDQKEDIKINLKVDCESSINSIQNLTNGHANVSSSYLSNSFRKGSFHSQKKSYDVPLNNGNCCVITYFDSFSSVFVVKASKSVTDNCVEIDDSYIISKTTKSTDKNVKSNPVVGDIVKVFSLSKNSFCRAKVLKNFNDGWYNVFLMDVGNIEKVSSDKIYELADEFQNKPGLAVKIGILDLLPSQCSENIINLFKKFIKEEKVFVIEFDEKAANCLENVRLKVENGSYLNMDYVNYCLSMEDPKIMHKSKCVSNSEMNPISTNYEEHITSGHQELISNTKCNSINIHNGFSNENTDNIQNDLICKTKKCSIDDFQNVVLVNGDLCTVSYFKDFENIYLCKAIKNIDSYENHNVKIVLSTMSNTDKIIKKNPVSGEIVRVFSSEFQGLYRAEILNIENDGSFLVHYIDFGNTEIVQSSDVFEISNELLDAETILPVRVSIKVPSCSKVTEEIHEFFKQLSEENILLSIEFNEKRTNGIENVILKYFESGKSINDKILKLLPTVKLPIKNGDSCILTHFDDFDNIYISQGHLTENSNFLDNVTNSSDRNVKANPLLGNIVKVLSPSYKDLYRAKIINVGTNGDFHVFYMDFGNIEVVKENNIFELSDDLKTKPELAIKIGLRIPSNIKLNEKIKAMFLDLAEETSELSIEFDETSEVGLQNCILKVISSGLNVNEEAIKLFSPQSNLSSVENFDINIKKHIDSHEVSKIKPLRNKEAVCITYTDNLSAIYVRKASEDNQFVDLHSKIDEETNTNMSNIKVEDIVKVPFDDMMCRALILDKKDKEHFYISFIDFGNTHSVHINEIFELSNELKKVPGFCTKIGLKSTLNIGQSELVRNYFKKFESEELIIEYDEDNLNGLNEASLKTKNNIDILDDLCNIVDKTMDIDDEELIEKSENKISSNLSEEESSLSIELKSGDIVFCCNFEDFDNMYLCKGSKNNITPESLNFIFDSSKLKDLTVKKNPKFEEMVLVKFEDKMVRAKVLNKSEKTYSVFLLDVGKSINVFADNIFEISNHLKQIPNFAIKVGLKRTKDLKTTKAIKEYFNKLWYEEPVPLIMTCDEGNFNYLNEVNLKRLSDSRDIIDDLYDICGISNGIPNKLNHLADDKRSSNINQCFLNGDHVEVLSGNNVDNISIRNIKLYDKYKNILEQLMKEKKDNLKTTTPRPYDVIAVYSSKHGSVYRAKVIGQSDEDSSKLRCALIDFGLFDIVQSKHLFALPNYASVNKVPLLTRKVALADLTKISSNSNVINSYLTSIIGKIFVLEYDKNAECWFKQVILKDLQNGRSVNEEIRKLLSLHTVDTHVSQQRRLERKIVVVNETKEVKIEKPCHPIKNGAHVNIVHFENFNAIYVRDASYEYLEKFLQFNVQMKKYYKQSNNLRIKEMVNIGDKVCVNTTLNQVMHCRALVLEKVGNEYKVFNVDYGNKELVNSDDIFELPEELGKLSYFAVQVQLQNMPQLSTEKEIKIIKDYFKKKIIGNNALLILEYNEYNAKGLDDVIFRTEYYKKDITIEIRKLLNAPPLNINTGISQTQKMEKPENPSSSTSDSYLSPYPARRHNNASNLV